MTGKVPSNGDPSLADLIASLRWSDAGATVVSIRPIQERKDSAIARVTIVEAGGRTREAIVKRHRAPSRDGRPAAELARHEFALLSRLSDALAGESRDGLIYSTPHPLLLDEEHGIVAMDEARGVPLDRLISAARRRAAPRRLKEPFRRAATWLHLVQRLTWREGGGRERLDAIVASAIDTLKRAADEDTTVRASREAIENRIHRLAKAISPQSLHAVGSHGDFWPGNVFVDERHVEVIDFEGFREGLPLQDVVYFLWYLEQLPLAVIDYGRLSRMFLEPYLAGSPLDENTFALLRLARALEAIAWRESASRSPLRRLLQRSPAGSIGRSLKSEERAASGEQG